MEKPKYKYVKTVLYFSSIPPLVFIIIFIYIVVFNEWQDCMHDILPFILYYNSAASLSLCLITAVLS